MPAQRVTDTAYGAGSDGAGAIGQPAAPGGITARAAAAMEFALTGGVLFVLVTAVRWVMASPVSRALPAQHLQLAAVAAMVAAALAGALSSPWGRRAGGHLNPATTLALWLTGAFPGRRVLPYVVAQLAGSVVGTGLARLVWGPVVGGPMAYAAVQPAPAWPAAAVFAAEAGATAAILAVALLLTSRPGWRRWTPLAMPAATAAVIIGLGPLTGGSANPARQFGPALWADRPGYWSLLWVYLAAPLAGAAFTALVTRCRAHLPGRSVRSGRARSRGRRSETDRCADGRTC
ncbi:aquaporin [Streptomyces sp. NPDC048277]|uniref:aquaporin n=1 Tax=Streptomyces sp. NPDC048277 TaxID=3155027 RepID=UPI0033DCE515